MKASIERQLIVSFLLLEQNTCQLLNFLLFIVSLIFVLRLYSILLPAFANACYEHLLKPHIKVVSLLAFQTRLLSSDLP